MMFLSLPSFWLGTLAIVRAVDLARLEPEPADGPVRRQPRRNLIAVRPARGLLGSHLGAPIMRMTRAMMLEVFRHDYVRTARAKGLAPGRRRAEARAA